MKLIVFCIMIHMSVFAGGFSLPEKTVEFVGSDGKPIYGLQVSRMVYVEEHKIWDILPLGSIGIIYPHLRYEQTIQAFQSTYGVLEIQKKSIVTISEVLSEDSYEDEHISPANIKFEIGLEENCSKEHDKTLTIDFFTMVDGKKINCADALSAVDAKLEDVESAYNTLPDHIVCIAEKTAKQTHQDMYDFYKALEGKTYEGVFWSGTQSCMTDHKYQGFQIVTEALMNG